MTRVVILNGPAGSGKDEAASYLQAKGNTTLGVPFAHQEFKKRLFDITKTIYNVSDEDWNNLYTRENKESSSDLLRGLSPRQALIFVSEEVIKPKYGSQYFGNAAVECLKHNHVNVFSDGGFIEELRPIISKIGVSNVLVLRIFREGCSFAGDSRNYLPVDVGPIVVDILNNGTKEEYYCTLEYEIARWLKVGETKE